MNVFTKWGIAELNLSSKRLALYHRLSPTLANNFGGFQGERAERRFCRWEMRDPKSPAQNRQIVTAGDEQCQKSREEEEVCNWKSGRNAKERAVAEGVMQEDYQAGMPWGFLAVAYFIGYLKVQIIRLMLKWCSQDHFLLMTTISHSNLRILPGILSSCGLQN